MAFFLKMSGLKVRALLLTLVTTAILSSLAIYVQCFAYSPLHVRLRAMHALSYGDKGHLYDCACVRRGPSLGTGAIACAHALRAQTLQHERQGRTLDYRSIEY